MAKSLKIGYLDLSAQFLKRGIIFLVLLLVVGFGLSQFYSRVIMKESRLYRSKSQFVSFQNDIDFLVMGDSHSLRSLDPAQISPSAFNYSSAGENYAQTYYKFKDLLKNHKKNIQYLVMPFDIHSFATVRFYRMKNSYFWTDYVNFVELGLASKKVLLYTFKFFRSKFFVFSGKRDKFFNFYNDEQDVTPMQNGFLLRNPKKKSFVESDRLAWAKKTTQAYFKNKGHLNKALLSYFEKIVDLAAENDIKVVLVKFPVTELYFQEANKAVSWEEHNKALDEVVKRHPNIVKVCDYHDQYFGKDEMFIDPHHLGVKGAREFSRLISTDLLPLKNN